LKVTYSPRFITDSSKAVLLLTSATLPELTYHIEGLSKFRLEQIYEEVEGFEGAEATKPISFKN
jgi:hypothetical protein